MHYPLLLLFLSFPLLSACNSLHSSATSSLFDLLNGFLSGLQADPLYPSHCVRAFTSVSPNWQEVASTADFAWSSGRLANFFLILYKLDEAIGLLIAALEKCSLTVFAGKLSALGTVEGVFKAMYQLGINIDQMAVKDT